MRRFPAIDMPLFLCFLLLVGLGITFVYTASYPKAMTDNGSDFAIAGKQILFACLGLAALFACMLTPLAFIHRHARTIGAVVVILLIMVLAIGTAKHGNKAWINIAGVQFQPSEFAKVAVIIFMASLVTARPWSVRSWKGLFIGGPYAYLIIPVGLVVLQQDLGTASVMLFASIIMLAIAGTRFRFWGVPMLVMVGLGAMVVLTSHRAERIEAWRNPFDRSIEASFQPRNSLIAVGSGMALGRGFCQSRQKWGYLPGAHNDYIFAIIAEELGFFLTVLLIFVPYLFMAFRGFSIANRAPDEFAALIAAGCTVMLTTQAVVNMCVVLNVIPCMGINLPFISYGGTSLIASMMMAGLLLNVSGLRVGQKHRRGVPVNEQPANG